MMDLNIYIYNFDFICEKIGGQVSGNDGRANERRSSRGIRILRCLISDCRRMMM